MAERKPFLGKSRPDEELMKLLEETREREISDEELFEQRVSFAYGNAMSDAITKENVRKSAKRFRSVR